MEREIQPNTLRFRVHHSRTERGPWRYDTTVELVGIAADVIDLDNQIERAMRRIDDLARAEARTRDRIDRE